MAANLSARPRILVHVVIVSVLFFLLALYFGTVGVLGLLGRLRPNRFAGVRTPATLRSTEAFTLANKVAAPTVIAAGAVFALGGAVALLADGWLAIGAVLAALVAAFVTAGAGSSLGIRAATALPDPAPASCSSCAGCSLKDACAPEPAQ